MTCIVCGFLTMNATQIYQRPLERRSKVTLADFTRVLIGWAPKIKLSVLFRCDRIASQALWNFLVTLRIVGTDFYSRQYEVI